MKRELTPQAMVMLEQQAKAKLVKRTWTSFIFARDAEG